jgi:AP-1 complex subunit gamma-1
MSNLKLREVIKQIRQCKTAAEERAVISKESALIRNAFKVCTIKYLSFSKFDL